MFPLRGNYFFKFLLAPKLSTRYIASLGQSSMMAKRSRLGQEV